MADQVFSRTAGAPVVAGNGLRVLRDAAENYPAWDSAIDRARLSVHVEMYIIHFDDVGRRFIERLAARARAGVAVRLVYDWFGCGTAPLRGLFTPLIKAGGEVRAFNPPTLTSALGWIRRNHRKMLVIDNHVAFVSGLCVGEEWLGRPDRQQEPWRDTGVEIIGPAVSHAAASFAESWRLAGGNAADCLVFSHDHTEPGGKVHLRLIPTEPFTANLLRLDLLIASLARKTLWLTDAYFIGTGPYLEALRRAARDGVDVRILLPQGSDVGWTVPISRSLYRPLLEAGVRIFEWNGTMIHAKTAIADSRWARIGSTNLNLNSWIGNWELDVAIEDGDVAATLEEHYLADLERSTEIVLKPKPGPMREANQAPLRARPASRRQRSSRRVVRTVTGVSRSLGAAVSGNRPLEDFEAVSILSAGLFLTATALTAFFAPRAIAWPVALVCTWMAVTFLVEAWTLWRKR